MSPTMPGGCDVFRGASGAETRTRDTGHGTRDKMGRRPLGGSCSSRHDGRVHNVERLEVHRDAEDLVVLVYDLTRSFPTDERFGLTAQMRRAAVSVPSNLAEGAGRGSDNEFKRFISIAAGSVAEVRSQTRLAMRLGFLGSDDCDRIHAVCERLRRRLRRLSEALDT